MEISENWLREWVNPEIDSDTLAAQLTMAGLEVEGMRTAAPEISGVVVAEVLAIEAHPNADKLRSGMWTSRGSTSGSSSFPSSSRLSGSMSTAPR